MMFQLPLYKDPTILPTNKYHVSYSEVVCWNDCSWRHKLSYIDVISKDEGSIHTAFGQAEHNILESYLLHHKESDFYFSDVIELNQGEFVKELKDLNYDGKDGKVEEWLDAMEKISKEVPGWLDTEFPGWELISAEFPLFEPVLGHKNKWFKGFMDTVIRYPKPPRKGSKPKPPGTPVEWEYWILDWKTTSWGWDMTKKTDKVKRMQLALYKHFWCTKLGIEPTQVKCAWVLLKRTAKDGKRCELVEVSVGDKTKQDALDLVSKMVNSVSKRMFLKNRSSCRFCRFQGTEHCP